MNYKVLARKYRPQDFKQLIGQDILVDTLINSIKNERLAHAFLLTGIRGVGKTTTARIIAKAFNCEGNNNKKPTYEICNNCKPCLSITNGNCLDVIELDAASKTGVDNIREIIDSVMYVPNETRLKIYIIDEVHMLSTAAFNALLKTLEEPPETCKFIFATTEIKKIPATIISRCQRFDLKRISNEVLIEHLKSVCAKEEIIIDHNSLHQISISSEGSVRDALSILDQIAALTSNKIEIFKLKEMLGLKDKKDYLKMFNYCLNGDAKEAIEIYDYLIHEGIQPTDIINTLIKICSEACKYTVNEKLLDNYKEEFNEISQHGITQLIRSWQILIKGLDELKNEINQIEIVSMIIVKLCFASQTPMPEEILKKIDKKFEKNIKKYSQEEIKKDHNEVNDTFSSDVQTSSNFSKKFVSNSSDGVKDLNIKKYKKFNGFDELLSSLIESKEGLLHAKLVNNIYLESFSFGEIKLKVIEFDEYDIVNKLHDFLFNETGFKWNIIEVNTSLNTTYNDIKDKVVKNENEKFYSVPIFKEIIEQFPNSKIKNVKKI